MRRVERDSFQRRLIEVPITANGRTAKSRRSKMEEFTETTRRISAEVLKCIEDGVRLNCYFDDEPDAIYIKDVGGRLLHTNPSYDSTFVDGKTAAGRHDSSFLSESMAKVSKGSDDLLLDGVLTMQFDHVGQDAQGREIKLRSFKRSLLGLGHPTIAMMGISRILDVVGNASGNRLQSLKDQWRQFSQLDDLDRAIAIGLAKGKAVRQLAIEGEVTKKTIENHRASILRKLDLNKPIDLIKLLVRLQENGFGDFGV